MYRSVLSPPRFRFTIRNASRGLARSLALVALAAALVPAAAEAAEAAARTPHRAAPQVRQTVDALRGDFGQLVRRADAAALAPRQGIDCVAQTIECGETVVTEITTQDCDTQDAELVYFDVFYFDGVAGQTITATMTSTAFDPFLFLFFPDIDREPITDDNSGGGLAAQIVHTLDETSSNWSLTPTPLEAFVTGPYTLTLECSGGGDPPPPPPSDGFFTDPEYPDFRFRVEIEPQGGEPIDGIHLDECQEDTVCVAGAVADRPELYIRILGPRPNGYLWPTLVRFTPSAVTVEIEQIHTGFTKTYTLDAVGPGEDDLPGLQDRNGFLP